MCEYEVNWLANELLEENETWTQIVNNAKLVNKVVQFYASSFCRTVAHYVER